MRLVTQSVDDRPRFLFHDPDLVIICGSWTNFKIVTRENFLIIKIHGILPQEHFIPIDQYEIYIIYIKYKNIQLETINLR